MKMKKILGLRTYCEKKTCSRGRVPEKPYKGVNTSRCSGHKSENISTGSWMLLVVWVRALGLRSQTFTGQSRAYAYTDSWLQHPQVPMSTKE